MDPRTKKGQVQHRPTARGFCNPFGIDAYPFDDLRLVTVLKKERERERCRFVFELELNHHDARYL